VRVRSSVEPSPVFVSTVTSRLSISTGSPSTSRRWWMGRRRPAPSKGYTLRLPSLGRVLRVPGLGRRTTHADLAQHAQHDPSQPDPSRSDAERNRDSG
jgi:hypothetical protein